MVWGTRLSLRLCVMALGLAVCAGGAAAEDEAHALLGRLILPDGQIGAAREDVRTRLEELGGEALPALIAATYLGQILTWAVAVDVVAESYIFLNFTVRVIGTPMPSDITPITAATGDGEDLPLTECSLELRAPSQPGAPPELEICEGETLAAQIAWEAASAEPGSEVVLAVALPEWMEYLDGSGSTSSDVATNSAAPSKGDAIWVRWDAVDVLGNLAAQDPETARGAVPALAARALTDTNPHPRWRSLWALAMYDSAILEDDILPRLREGLGSPEPQVVWNAAVALAFFSQSEATPYLNSGLASADEMHAWEAAYCLGMVHDEASVPLLTAMLGDAEGTASRLRQEAALTLGKIGSSEAIPALVAALEDPEAGVRWRAASSLARLGDPTVVPAIEAAAAKETDPFAKEQMVEAGSTLQRLASS